MSDGGGRRITEHIWLRAFDTLPKSSLTAGLQIRSSRYMKLAHAHIEKLLTTHVVSVLVVN